MIPRLLNIISSVSLLATIYLINKGMEVRYILSKIGVNFDVDVPKWISYLIYIALPIIFAFLVTLLFPKLRPGELKGEKVSELSADNSTILAMILGYIFVGLSIQNSFSLMIVMIMLVIFNLCGNTYLYNPIFYLFRYRYYYVTTSGIKILVMTKKKIKLGQSPDFSKVRCLNDFTYIDNSKN